MLERDVHSVDVIGSSVGYEDPASFLMVYKRGVGLSPAAYRKKFQHILQIAKPIGER